MKSDQIKHRTCHCFLMGCFDPFSYKTPQEEPSCITAQFTNATSFEAIFMMIAEFWIANELELNASEDGGRMSVHTRSSHSCHTFPPNEYQILEEKNTGRPLFSCLSFKHGALSALKMAADYVPCERGHHCKYLFMLHSLTDSTRFCNFMEFLYDTEYQ